MGGIEVETGGEEERGGKATSTQEEGIKTLEDYEKPSWFGMYHIMPDIIL